MNKKQQASLETSKKILAIARKHFSLKGYAETSLEEIVDELGMTRGALYHHFGNKKTLFTAVLAQIQSELGSYVEKKRSGSTRFLGAVGGRLCGFCSFCNLDRK